MYSKEEYIKDLKRVYGDYLGELQHHELLVTLYNLLQKKQMINNEIEGLLEFLAEHEYDRNYRLSQKVKKNESA